MHKKVCFEIKRQYIFMGATFIWFILASSFVSSIIWLIYIGKQERREAQEIDDTTLIQEIIDQYPSNSLGQIIELPIPIYFGLENSTNEKCYFKERCVYYLGQEVRFSSSDSTDADARMIGFSIGESQMDRIYTTSYIYNYIGQAEIVITNKFLYVFNEFRFDQIDLGKIKLVKNHGNLMLLFYIKGNAETLVFTFDELFDLDYVRDIIHTLVSKKIK